MNCEISSWKTARPEFQFFGLFWIELYLGISVSDNGVQKMFRLSVSQKQIYIFKNKVS
jgi:uncharacterized membrane protein